MKDKTVKINGVEYKDGVATKKVFEFSADEIRKDCVISILDSVYRLFLYHTPEEQLELAKYYAGELGYKFEITPEDVAEFNKGEILCTGDYIDEGWYYNPKLKARKTKLKKLNG
jgi:hypothetical protein